MMRLVITFLLSLSFLLLRGYDHLYALTNQNRICYSPAKLQERLEQAGLGNTKNNQSVIRKATSSTAENDAITATEKEDDDELLSPRKYVEITNYYITLFYAQASDYFSNQLKTGLPFCQHFPYTSSDRYIVQRVIRI